MEVEDVLRRRYWLRTNFEWFMNEVTFYKEMSKNFSERRLIVWEFGNQEGKVKISDETSFRSD